MRVTLRGRRRRRRKVDPEDKVGLMSLVAWSHRSSWDWWLAFAYLEKLAGFGDLPWLGLMEGGL